jgi:hypothetical protein
VNNQIRATEISGKELQWTNFFDPKTHKGNQPVRVLQYDLLGYLERTNETFAAELSHLIKRFRLRPGIIYECSDEPIARLENGRKFLATMTVKPVPGPESASNQLFNKQIFLYETFLSYLWCVTYVLIVLFYELVKKPARVTLGLPFRPLLPKTRAGAVALLDYAPTLIERFSKWDTSTLPNPETYPQSEAYYIEKTNGIFVHAANFCLCHELGHVAVGHIEPTRVTSTEPDLAGR